jgi:hypothetical protein
MIRQTYKGFLVVVLLLSVVSSDAQRRRTKKKATPVKKTVTTKEKNTESQTNREALGDTSAPKVVTVTSAFKPSLKNAAKINFTAASSFVDSSRTPVTYTVPSQNLFFSYQPVPIRPLALPVDTGFHWQNDHSVKVGLGNFNSFLLSGAFSFGDGVKSNTIVTADYLTNKGNLFAQQYANLGLSVLSVFNTNNNNEWTTKAWYKNTTRYFYGYDTSLVSYSKESLLRRFNHAGIEVGLRNKKANAFNITYAPKISLHYFSDNRSNKEYNAVLNAPLKKKFGDHVAIDLGITADIAKSDFEVLGIGTRFKQTNNLFYVSPSVEYVSKGFRLSAGIRPSWDNSKYATLPNITAEVKVPETPLVAEAGWHGYFNKNSYRSIADFNPWVYTPTLMLMNTKVMEQYAGIKGSAGNHLTYRARLSFQQLNNQPVFPNTVTDGKAFNVLYESTMNVVQIHGELGYTLQEKLSLLAGATFRRFSNMPSYEPWGLLPFEVTGSLKWKILKDLQLKADVFFWDGSKYRNTSLNTLRLKPAADLNLGAEFSVMPKLNLWVQLNNVLNNKYQRWNQYEVLGLNVLGGVVYSFR